MLSFCEDSAPWCALNLSHRIKEASLIKLIELRRPLAIIFLLIGLCAGCASAHSTNAKPDVRSGPHISRLALRVAPAPPGYRTSTRDNDGNPTGEQTLALAARAETVSGSIVLLQQDHWRFGALEYYHQPSDSAEKTSSVTLSVEEFADANYASRFEAQTIAASVRLVPGSTRFAINGFPKAFGVALTSGNETSISVAYSSGDYVVVITALGTVAIRAVVQALATEQARRL